MGMRTMKEFSLWAVTLGAAFLLLPVALCGLVLVAIQTVWEEWRK